MASESPKASKFRQTLSEIITGLRFRAFRDDEPELVLDTTPTGEEEERYLFEAPVEDPTDLNPLLEQAERIQDMGERRLFSDRAFIITIVWVGFLILLPFVQMIFSLCDAGLTDGQFIAVVTTTTAAVFGFWVLVGRYLFPPSRKPTARR